MHEKLNKFCLLNIISKNYSSTVYIWQYCKFLSVRRKSNANVANFVKLKPRFFMWAWLNTNSEDIIRFACLTKSMECTYLCFSQVLWAHYYQLCLGEHSRASVALMRADRCMCDPCWGLLCLKAHCSRVHVHWANLCHRCESAIAALI